MKKWLFLALFGASLGAEGGSLKGGEVICISEDAYDEAVTALVREDEQWWNHLVSSKQCVVSKPGIRAQHLDGWLGVCKLKVFLGNQAADIWTACENYLRD